MKIILLIVMLSTIVVAQTSVPFASSNNKIELSVRNSSIVEAENIKVEVMQKPDWITFLNPQSEISNLKSNEALTANFTFSVNKTAPINETGIIEFAISNLQGERWSKIVSIQVSAPETFELYQNYPNPFNPTTVISFLIPQSPFTKGEQGGFVTLKIYDAIGREVATLLNEYKTAGYHEVSWNASNFSTGMYVYELAYKSGSEKKHLRKKLMLTK